MTDTPLNVLIPMGGLGSRFAKAGYRVPKPMVNIVGRPMLLRLLDYLVFKEGDTLWIAMAREMEEEYALRALLEREYPHLRLCIILLDFQTRGAAETLYVILQNMSAEDRKRKTISLDCDTIYFTDVLLAFRRCPNGCGASFYFQDTGDKPIFSYIRLGSESADIVDIREKVAISRHANTGAYAFASGTVLREACRQVLDNPVGAAGEFYTSALIGSMIREGKRFVGIHVPSFTCVGTPSQLQEFLAQVRNGEAELKPRVRFCFELRSTLLPPRPTSPVHAAQRRTARNARLIRELRAAGNEVVLWTSRADALELANRFGAPAAAAEEASGERLIAAIHEFLETLEVSCDDVVYDKPKADAYFGCPGSRATIDAEKEVGWVLGTDDAEDCCSLELDAQGGDQFEAASAAAGGSSSSGSSGGSESSGEAGLPRGFVPPRCFNHLAPLGDTHIVKSGLAEHLSGEIFFYKNVPEAVRDLFPAVAGIHDGANVARPSITLQKVDGVSFSHLAVGNCLTAGRLQALLAALHRLHTCLPAPPVPMRSKSSPLAFAGADAAAGPLHAAPAAVVSAGAPKFGGDFAPRKCIDVCANYGAKLRSRFAAHEALYASLDEVEWEPLLSRLALPAPPASASEKRKAAAAEPTNGERAAVTAARVLDVLLAFFAQYEQEGRFEPAVVIHGDPVFSNCLTTKDARVVLLDMRGALGERLTTAGDVNYDLAKVFQSLCGYDCVVLARRPDERAREAYAELQAEFWSWVAAKYPNAQPRDIRIITASHFCSMVPLHVDRGNQLAFLAACKGLLRDEGLLLDIEAS